MLKVLSRRWLGVTVWAYLLALSLALLVYWLLPKDAALHRWTFNGTVAVVGFTPDQSQMVLAIHGGYAFLDLKTGMVERVSAIEDSDRQQLVVPEKVPYQLSYTAFFFENRSPEIDLVNTRDGSRRNVPVNDSAVNVASGGITIGGRVHATIKLSTSGRVAMSPDHSRLLLSSRRFSNWFRMMNWMEENWNWSPSWLPEGTSHHMLIVNLLDNTLTEHELRFHRDTKFVIHPAGTGFAVVDRDWFFNASANKPSTISWYALPPGTAHHTLNQWLAILGAFMIPVLFSFSRRKRHQPSV